MNFQVLPNWFKKLGLTMFILFSFCSGYDDFLKGWHSYDNPAYNGPHFFENSFGIFTLTIFSALSMLGLLVYMLSKEKIEDEYVKILRLESYQLTIIITISTSLILYVISKDLELTLDYFILLYMIIYLLIFSMKKRNQL